MIFGVGTDIVDKKRIAESLEKFGEKFAIRVLTEKEFVVYLSKNEIGKVDYLSRRFAAKEAVSKSLGCGIGEELSFQDVEVLNDAKGKPNATASGYSDYRFNISISDEKDSFAIAFVVAEKI